MFAAFPPAVSKGALPEIGPCRDVWGQGKPTFTSPW